ncbi:MAG: SMC-Scp complex subunit ScpB [Candidatus Omnitrophica bacterium]|nr:SMC-Scp complex subunit ScpB [Candidatus Omnitrophota bacterium]
MDQNELRRVLEAFLFISSAPVPVTQVKEVLGVDEPLVKKAIEDLKVKYSGEDSSFRLYEIAGGYRLSTAPELAPYLKKWFKGQKSRLSRASIETLSIVAYKQPVTRSELEAIRGVNVEGPLDTLLERGLIRITGRRETVGRPILYGTTRLFLEHFGLNTLKDLPILNEFSEFDLSEEERDKIAQLNTGAYDAVQEEGGSYGDNQTS